eukprot:sb/3468754/
MDGQRLEHVQLGYLFQFLQIDQVIQLFASVLLERRILISSSHHHLSKLSSCVSCMATLTYPLHWECIFIPMLPRQMIHAVLAPTPFLIGALTEDLKEVERDLAHEEEPMLHFNLDTGQFISCYGDEESLLPHKSRDMLRSALEETVQNLGQDVDKNNMAISQVFLLFMYKLLGHYKNHLTEFHGHREVDLASFIPATRRYLRPLMDKVSETQALSVFSINICDPREFEQFKTLTEERHASQSHWRRTFS